VTTVGGEVLLNTLINPSVPIPTEATGIHGITDDMVTEAPTFTDILVRLTAALDGRRCLIYNAPYDTARLRFELTRHYRSAGHSQPERSAAAWLDVMTFEDAMIPYSDWYGDWSEYFGNFAWQPLYGGDHRALGDCLAVIDCLKEMSAEQPAEQIAVGGWSRV
jgi:DNA polymerase III epsilon subunit-like protein